MAEWLFESGIGECRAILVDAGTIVEAQIERPGLRAGSVVAARLTAILVPARRGIATMGDGTEILVEPLPKVAEGAHVRVAIVREAVPEPGALKRAKGRITEAELCVGPDLVTRLGAPRALGLYDSDLFEAAGWSECLEEAASGIVRWPGGIMRLSLTPAMALIDIDGDDAINGARAAGAAIRRFGIAGNIGIDLPTVAGKAERQAIAAAFDAALPQPFERTSVNGFGFLQVVRPRARASLCEMTQYDPVGAAARALLRRAQRAGIVGRSELVANPQVVLELERNLILLQQLEAAVGGRVSLRSDSAIAFSGGTLYRID